MGDEAYTFLWHLLAAGRAAVEERTCRGMSVFFWWKFSHPGFASFAYDIYTSSPFFFLLFLVS